MCSSPDFSKDSLGTSESGELGSESRPKVGLGNGTEVVGAIQQRVRCTLILVYQAPFEHLEVLAATYESTVARQSVLN